MSERTCSVDGCDSSGKLRRGWCDRHYLRWRRYGDPVVGPKERRLVDGKKCCTVCSVWKPLEAFPRHKHGMGGRNSACVDCAVSMSKEWAKRNPAKLDAYYAARRARVRSGNFEAVDRQRVFERDGYICRLCGDLLDMNENVPHLLAPTVDHVIPLSRGGEHNYFNVQAAHFICNVRKGAQVPH